jgi:hypothetical protein
MSLSCRLMLGRLTARRVKDLESSGPRKLGGVRFGFSPLKPGWNARRSPRLRDRLISPRYDRWAPVYGQIRSRIAQTPGVATPDERRWCDGLDVQTWCRTPGPRAAGPGQNKAEKLKKINRLKMANLIPSMNWWLRRSGGGGNPDSMPSVYTGPTPIPSVPQGGPAVSADVRGSPCGSRSVSRRGQELGTKPECSLECVE